MNDAMNSHVAMFATVKDGAFSYQVHMYGPSREHLAARIARMLKNRHQGSLLDIALVEAEDVMAECFTVEEVMAQAEAYQRENGHTA